MGQNAISRTRVVHIDSNKQTKMVAWSPLTLDLVRLGLAQGALAAVTLGLVPSPNSNTC